MASSSRFPLVKDIRGTLGDIVFRRLPNGEVVASKKPDMSKVTWSTAQKTHRQRFKKAIAYAKAGKRPFDQAVSDYFKGRDLVAPKST